MWYHIDRSEQHPVPLRQGGIGELGRPRDPHKVEIAGSNPAPASNRDWLALVWPGKHEPR